MDTLMQMGTRVLAMAGVGVLVLSAAPSAEAGFFDRLRDRERGRNIEREGDREVPKRVAREEKREEKRVAREEKRERRAARLEERREGREEGREEPREEGEEPERVIPEPSAALVFGLGLLLARGTVRRKR